MHLRICTFQCKTHGIPCGDSMGWGNSHENLFLPMLAGALPFFSNARLFSHLLQHHSAVLQFLFVSQTVELNDDCIHRASIGGGLNIFFRTADCPIQPSSTKIKSERFAYFANLLMVTLLMEGVPQKWECSTSFEQKPSQRRI